jgi:hypothetical protein
MDFITAVKELSEKRCKGIKREHWGCYISMMPLVSQWNKEPNRSTCGFHDYLADDWVLIEPVPEMEYVDIIQWTTVDGNGECSGMWPEQHYAVNAASTYGGEVVKLTGNLLREKKKKIKKRVKVETLGECEGNFDANIAMYAEWEA